MGRGVIWQFLGGVQHVYCAKFMLTVSHNGNPIINNRYSLRQNTQKAWIMFWIKMLTWQNEQDLQH